MRSQFDGESLQRELFDLAELLDESLQIIDQIEALAMDAVAALQSQHVVDHAVETQTVFLDDRREALDGVVDRGLLLQELCGVANRTEGIADLVCDFGRKAAERGEL